MFRHLIRLGLRNLYKNKSSTTVNILSLTLGITILLLIAVYAQNELITDRFHNNSTRIFKATYGTSSATPGPLAEELRSEFPEIQYATHLEINQLSALSPVLVHNNNSFDIEGIYSTDTAFLNIFDFKITRGDKLQPLSNPFSIVLTESEADRIFQDKDPVGETIIWKTYSDFSFTVTAIVEDVPQNSSIQFRGLISESSIVKMGRRYTEDWGMTVYETYFLLSPNTDRVQLEEKFREYLKAYYKANLSATASFADSEQNPLSLHPLREVYFNNELTNDTTNRGNLLLIRVLISIGIVIMLLSVINYVNLSTAQASLRNKEVGIQRINGCDKTLLMFQYITETILLSFISTITGLILAMLLLPGFSQFMNLHQVLSFPSGLLFWMTAFILVIGIIAGLYPAIFLSSQNVLNVMKQGSRLKHRGINIRHFLVMFQFLVSITLIAVSFLIVKQVNYVKSRDLGIDKEHIIYAKLPIQIFRGKKEIFRERLQSLPDVQMVAFSSTVFGMIEELNNQEVNGKILNFASAWVDAEFIDLYDLQLIEGRFFSNEMISDVNSTLLLNETAVKEFGEKDPHSIEIRVPGGKAKVVGIIRDFNFKSLHNRIEPMAIVFLPRQGRYANIKLSGNNTTQTLNEIAKIWNDLAPEIPFNYEFMDASFDRLYRSDVQMGKAILYFSLIAVIIAVLGVLSLSVFIGQSRVQEISIRKINGARILDVILVLNKSLAVNLLIAFIMACPAAWYIMKWWLDGFAYKTTVSVWIFLCSGLIVSVLTLTVISFQSWRFALKNPIDTLRYE
ncbi:ABC transporter permease [Bacteroidota bacterium]